MWEEFLCEQSEVTAPSSWSSDVLPLSVFNLFQRNTVGQQKVSHLSDSNVLLQRETVIKGILRIYYKTR